MQGIVKMAVIIADALTSRVGREFRKPSDEQIVSFSKPVARILVRHLDMTALSDDIVDLTEAGGEASGWLLEGPVAPRRYPHAELPDMEHDPLPGNESQGTPWDFSTPVSESGDKPTYLS